MSEGASLPRPCLRALAPARKHPTPAKAAPRLFTRNERKTP